MLQALTKNQDILNTQLNVEKENNLNSGKLVEIEDIEDTPFKLVTTESGSFIGYGNNRLTEIMPSRTECIEILEKKDWNFLGTFIISVITSFNNYQNENK